MAEDPFDPEVLRLKPEDIPAATGQPKPRGPKRSRVPFVKFPTLWAEQLAAIRAHGSTYRVALLLLGQAWRTDNKVVKLTNTTLTGVGVGRKGKAIALKELRRAGLVAIEQQPNRNPLVKVRFDD